MTQANAKAARIAAELKPPARGLLSRPLDWLLHRVWFVHADLLLTVDIGPAVVMQVLLAAAKPRRERLELGSLFTDGRRYFFRQRGERGFSMITTSKVSWHTRRRTNASAIVFGNFTPLNEGQATRIYLRGRIKLFYLLSLFLWPVFMTSIIVFMPWSPTVIALALGLLFLLAWLGHRNNAALEAAEMIYFIEKVLEDYIPGPAPQLAADTADVVYDRRQFTRAWERFYEEHKEA